MKKLMMKTCCAAAVALCAVASVQAQSSVTLYGVVDVYAEYGKAVDTTKKLQSGGLSGSRVGFKGEEDLGGGLKAIFQLESGFNADDGTLGQGGLFFGRQALVGLAGGFGSITAGRQYTPTFITLDADDPFDTGAGSAIESGIVSMIAARVNNSVFYDSPNMGGFSFNALVSSGEHQSTPNGGIYAPDQLGTPGLYSASARYTYGPGSIAISWAQAGTDQPKPETVAVSGHVDFQGVKLFAGYQRAGHIADAGIIDGRDEFWLGGILPVGPGAFTVGYGRGKFRNIDETTSQQGSLGYTYNLSKRTSLYGVGTYIKNEANVMYTANTATAAGPDDAPGVNVKALQVGIRHSF